MIGPLGVLTSTESIGCGSPCTSGVSPFEVAATANGRFWFPALMIAMILWSETGFPLCPDQAASSRRRAGHGDCDFLGWRLYSLPPASPITITLLVFAILNAWPARDRARGSLYYAIHSAFGFR